MDWTTVRTRGRFGAICLITVAGMLLPGCTLGSSHTSTETAMKPAAQQYPLPAPAAAMSQPPAAVPAPEAAGEAMAAGQPQSTLPPQVEPEGQGGWSSPMAVPAGVRLVSEETMVPAALAPQAAPPAAIISSQPSLPLESRVARRPATRAVLHASEDSFDEQVLKSDVPVLVDFYARWCGPCKSLAPMLEELAAETPQARIVKVDVDDNPRLAAQYGVRSLPSLMVFKGGMVTARQKGAVGKARLKAMLDL
jgi:thioredoxin 1